MNGDRISNFSYALRYCSLSFPYFQTTEIYFHSILTITETILFIYLIYLSFPRGGKVKKIYIKYIPLYLETNQKEVIWFSSVFFLQYFDIKGRTDHIYFTRIWQHRLNAKNQTAFEINCFFHQILSAFFSVNSKKKIAQWMSSVSSVLRRIIGNYSLLRNMWDLHYFFTAWRNSFYCSNIFFFHVSVSKFLWIILKQKQNKLD